MSRFAARRSFVLLAGLVLGVVVAFPIGVLASHQFLDVPDSNDYHADIDAIADAGVTTGCGGGNYCPSAFVTREQMAAFMNRLGALGPGKTPVVNATKLDGLDSTQFVRSDEANPGRFVCPGVAFQPKADGTDYTSNGHVRLLVTGPAYFECPVLLPDGATITKFEAGVYDANAGAGIECALYRGHHFTSGAPAQLAQAVTDGVGGDLTITDTTISNAIVANGTYGYYAECYLGAAAMKIMGVIVEYTVTGLPLP